MECVFIGYSTNYRGYKCLAPNGRVYVSRDVLFNEYNFPYQSSASHTHPYSNIPSASPLVLCTEVFDTSSNADNHINTNMCCSHSIDKNTDCEFHLDAPRVAQASPLENHVNNTSTDLVHSTAPIPSFEQHTRVIVAKTSTDPVLSTRTIPSPQHHSHVSAASTNTHSMTTCAKYGVFKP